MSAASLIDLDGLIRETDRLDPLPPSATRLAALLGRDDWEMSDLVGIVRLDPALTGRLLRLANAAASAGASRISTVRDAAMRLGAGSVVGAAVAGATARMLQEPLEAYGAEAGTLWRHSVAAALSVEWLPRVARLRPPAEAFTAAVLHDAGKLVLCSQLGADVVGFLERAHAEGGLTVADAELEVLGVTHAELGGLLAQHWGLPAAIGCAIAHHHDPEVVPDEAHRERARIVSLADMVARRLVPGLGEEPPVPDEVATACHRLGLEPACFEALADEVSEHLDRTVALYG